MLAVTFLCGAGIVQAQPPQPPPPAAAPAPPAGPWTGNAGLGLSLNRGNTATTNLNVSAEATHDPKKRSVWKFKTLYLRGKNNGELAVDRFLAEVRDELNLTSRVYAFGQLQFLEALPARIDVPPCLDDPGLGQPLTLLLDPEQ